MSRFFSRLHICAVFFLNMESVDEGFPQVVGFSILKKLGAGAFATVYEARDEASGQIVAVKKCFATNAQERGFMKQELEILASVQQCENIVRLLKVAESCDDSCVIVLEKVEPLSEYAHRMSMYSDVCSILRGVSLALAFLHAASIAHLDVKSDNVMLRNAVAVLIDFGFAVRVSEPIRVLTCTVDYQSPEIAKTEATDPRTCDCWALGVLGHLLLTGIDRKMFFFFFWRL